MKMVYTRTVLAIPIGVYVLDALLGIRQNQLLDLVPLTGD
jgi:hypothetical protein